MYRERTSELKRSARATADTGLISCCESQGGVQAAQDGPDQEGRPHRRLLPIKAPVQPRSLTRTREGKMQPPALSGSSCWQGAGRFPTLMARSYASQFKRQAFDPKMRARSFGGKDGEVASCGRTAGGGRWTTLGQRRGGPAACVFGGAREPSSPGSAAGAAERTPARASTACACCSAKPAGTAGPGIPAPPSECGALWKDMAG